MSKIKNNKGFTLIELLIVMVILGILVAIVFTNIDVAKLTGRGNDTKRISDLRSMQDGILREQAQGYLTLTTSGGPFTSLESNPQSVVGTGWVRFSTTPAAPSGYKFSNLPVLPLDPQNNTEVTYTVIEPGSTSRVTVKATAKYVLCVDTNGGFEINTLLANDPEKMNNDGGNDNTAYEVGTNLNACDANTKFGTSVSTQ